jgi:opacity protein-like surface antigen
MKKIGVALFAFALWLSLAAVAQDTGAQQPSGDQGSMSQGQMSGKKAHSKSHLMGKISDDGKTLTDKSGQSWTIDNPDAVKGHEGHEVTLRGHVDTAANSIHVTSVKMSGERASKKKSGTMSEQPPQ